MARGEPEGRDAAPVRRPRALVWVLERVFSRDRTEDLLQDLDLEFSSFQGPSRGPLRARLWYARQIALSLAVGLPNRLKAYMTHLRQDLSYALRTFLKAPGFTLVAVLVLGIGSGANTAIFTIVNQMVFKPLSGRADELVGLYSRDRTEARGYRAFSYANYADIREQAGIFDGLLAHTFSMAGTPAGDTTRRTFVQLVSSNFFDTLGVTLAAGRPFTLDEERPGAGIPVVIVPYERRAELGTKIRINAEDFTVVGVAPKGFTGTMAMVGAEMYLPLGMFDVIVNDLFKNNRLPLSDRANPALIVAGRVKDDVSADQAKARLDALSRQLEAAYPGENRNQELSTSPLSRMSSSTSPGGDGGLAAFAALLLGLSGIVLVIACLNIANMLLARGAARAKEIALRLALGAGRARVVRQLLTESVLLAGAGAALGLVLGFWATRGLATSLTSILPLQVNFTAVPDLRVMAATIGLAALSTIAFGLGPALRLSRRDLVNDLKDRSADGAGSGRRFSARNIMVVAQVSLSLAMLTAGGIFAKTAVSASRIGPGYSYDQLLIASLDGGIGGYDVATSRRSYRSILTRLRETPGIASASVASSVAFGDTREGETVERVAGTDNVGVDEFRIIGANYFKTLGVPLVRGREFTEAEEQSPDAPRVAIIDEVLAREVFGDEDPIGQMIRSVPEPGRPSSGREVPMQVIGIAPPMRVELLRPTLSSHLFVPLGREFRANLLVHVRLARGIDDLSGLDLARQSLREADPGMPVLSLMTMHAMHDKGIELWALRTGARLFTLLGGVALLLAVVGVYGVKSYVVSQRTREIGIRMALGADAAAVLKMMLRDGMMLTGAGVLIGVPLAVAVSMLMASVFVDLGGFDPTVVTVATLVLGVSAAVATIIPSRRASRIEPLKALRAE